MNWDSNWSLSLVHHAILRYKCISRPIVLAVNEYKTLERESEELEWRRFHLF